MSLIQHVSAVEGVDHEPEPGDAGFDTASLRLSRPPSIAWSISYDPLPGGAPPAEKHEPIAAYEVSQGRRIGTLAPDCADCDL